MKTNGVIKENLEEILTTEREREDEREGRGSREKKLQCIIDYFSYYVSLV